MSIDNTIVPASTRVMNLAHFVVQASRRQPGGVALAWGERSWTWAEFESRVSAMASALRQRFGVEKGDRILVHSPNCNQMFEAMFACFRIGAVYVPTNFRQLPDEAAQTAQTAGAVGMICNAAFPEHAAACLAKYPELRFAIAIGDAAFGPSFDALVQEFLGSPSPEAAVDRDDPCWFFFTSGTTGRPKASVLTHGQMAFVATNHLCDLMPGLRPGDTSLVVAPLSHGAGVHQLAMVARGVTTVLMPSERFDVSTAWALIERWRVATLFVVPTILKLMVDDPAVDEHDHASLRYVIYAGAPMYREDQKRALAKLGPVLVQYYGLGEVTGNITVLPDWMHTPEDGPQSRPGTCGFPRTGMQVEIQDEHGEPVAPGQTGEICVIGPAVFAGYYRDAESTSRAFRNGWFRTGDLGHVDADGFVYITGRASDMYISGGSNIYPREIEEKILMHPAISEVAVLGMPDPLWGEVGVAICVTVPGSDATAVDLAAFLSDSIARYKMPRHFLFWPSLPKSAYGKVSKKVLREELLRRGEPAGAATGNSVS